LIRHAGSCQPLPISPLTIPMIQSSFRTLLMTAVGSSPLLSPGFGAAALAAIPMSSVAATADQKESPASFCVAKPLKKNNFGSVCHPRLKARLDNGCRPWQPKAMENLS
jgi:hypothetical protein